MIPNEFRTDLAARFTVDSDPAPEAGGPFPDEQHDLYTATIWTLHLPVPIEHQSPDALGRWAAQIIVADACAAPAVLLPMYCGGDSFVEWAERCDDSLVERALHLYFSAAGWRSAAVAGRQIGASLGITRYAVSTAGDWAAQVPQ